MNISKQDIEEYINHNKDLDEHIIIYELCEIYNCSETYELYMIHKLVTNYIDELSHKEELYNKRRIILSELKTLDLPEQRSPEWYELRRKILTASSLASALDKCHFTSRDELLYDKIVEKPYVGNEITEWGVKYEDVAIMFYEELYNVHVLDFGLIPHPEFDIFGASPDGICDDTGNDEYIGRMVEIKCPPKRKFTKTVPPHYLMQVQGQLEVCDLDECDFFQVKLEEYDSKEDYLSDYFEVDGEIIQGRTSLNYPKGVTLTYKDNETLSYKYCPFNQSIDQLNIWIDSQPTDDLYEIKWWKITRYETTLVTRDKQWWYQTIPDILSFYNDLLYYQQDDNIKILQKKVEQKKSRKKKPEIKELDKFLLID
jgi:putative phage-type endonuclease